MSIFNESWLLNGDNSITVNFVIEPPTLGATFVSAIVRYGPNGIYPNLSAAVTGPDGSGNCSSTIPPQGAGQIIYFDPHVVWSTLTEDGTAQQQYVPFNTSTGKYNALASFNTWLTTNVPTTLPPGWTYSFFQQQENNSYPLVQATEFMAPDPGSQSMGMIVAPFNTYKSATQGKKSAMGIRIEIQDDIGLHPNAMQTIYQIRDLIKRALINAGVADDLTGYIGVPAIEILDYTASPSAPPDTQITGEVRDPEGLIERYIPPDTAVPNIHTIELLLRFEWMEMN